MRAAENLGRFTSPGALHLGRFTPDQTRTDNLAPLSRKPHRAKTARAWQLTQYDGGWLEWTSPAGYHYATGPHGTLRQLPATAA